MRHDLSLVGFMIYFLMKRNINKIAKLIITTENRLIQEDSQLTMDSMLKLRNFLIEENFQPEDVFPTLIYTSVQMFLDGFESMDLGREALLQLVDESIKSQMKLREEFEKERNPVNAGLFNDHVEEYPELLH